MATFGTDANYYPLSYYDHNKNNNNNNNLMVSPRKRWSATNEQLRMLEKMFNEGHGTPSKAKIKAMTDKLSKFGPITDNNVYNWFQNRRARSKKKQKLVQVEPPPPPPPPPSPLVPLHVESQSLTSSATPVPTPTIEDDDSLVFLNLEDLGSWPKDAALSELNGL